MTPAEWEQAQAMIACRTRKWREHPDYEDLKQEALLATACVIDRQRRQGKTTAVNTVADHQSRWAVLDFLRTRATLGRAVRRPGQAPEPVFVSVDALAQYQEEHSEWREADEVGWLPRAPDFTDALVDQLDAERIAAFVLSRCSPREREALLLYFWEGLTQGDVGVRMGVSQCRVQQLLRAGLAHYRTPCAVWVGPTQRDDTTCLHGHAWTEENTYTTPQGKRQCIACRRDKGRRQYRQAQARKESLCP